MFVNYDFGDFYPFYLMQMIIYHLILNNLLTFDKVPTITDNYVFD